MASGVYNTFKADLLAGTHDLDTDVLKVALLDNSHAFTAENDTWADVSANEVSGTGYTAGGATLANCAITTDDTDDEGVLDCDDPSWTSASFTAYHAVVYNTSQSDKLIRSIDFGEAKTIASGTFSIQIATEGLLNTT